MVEMKKNSVSYTARSVTFPLQANRRGSFGLPSRDLVQSPLRREVSPWVLITSVYHHDPAFHASALLWLLEILNSIFFCPSLSLSPSPWTASFLLPFLLPSPFSPVPPIPPLSPFVLGFIFNLLWNTFSLFLFSFHVFDNSNQHLKKKSLCVHGVGGRGRLCIPQNLYMEVREFWESVLAPTMFGERVLLPLPLDLLRASWGFFGGGVCDFTYFFFGMYLSPKLLNLFLYFSLFLFWVAK